jgi:ABC-type glycerol-3-phosphate transport system permease component
MADQRIEPILAESARPTAVAIPTPVAVSVPGFRRPRRLGQLLERQDILAVLLLAPTLTILTLFIAYPFVLGIWLAVSDKVVGRPGAFVGLENFRVNLNDTIFLRAFQNTFVYTFIATALKLCLGMVAALLLNHHFNFIESFELTMFARWAWNTLFIATVSTTISLFCGLLAGYALARLQFRWAAPLGTLIFVTYLVPPTLLFIPLGDVVKTFGLGDAPWAVILTYPTFLIPFCTWLLLGYSTCHATLSRPDAIRTSPLFLTASTGSRPDTKTAEQRTLA